MRIRTMTEADLEAVSALERDNFSQPWSLEAFRAELNSDHAIYVVAEVQDRVVGVCGMILYYDFGEIVNVSVDKGSRRLGIARQMLTTLLELARQAGCMEYTLDVRAGNQPAILLYESLGFALEGIRRGFYKQPTEDSNVYWLRNKQNLPL